MTQDDWTPELIEEYKKCANDVIYFAEKYFKIINLDTGKVPVKLYTTQKRIIRKIMGKRFSVFATSRQVGKTTIETIIALWYSIFNKDFSVAILSPKESMASEVMKRIQMAYYDLPDFLRMAFVSCNKDTLRFDNGSRIYCSIASTDSMRGRSTNVLILDEFAFVRDSLSNDFYKSIIPTISSSKRSKMILLSTPNGTQNKFYEICQHAITHPEMWEYEQITWRDFPELYDEDWMTVMFSLLNKDLKMWDQEYEAQFID